MNAAKPQAAANPIQTWGVLAWGMALSIVCFLVWRANSEVYAALAVALTLLVDLPHVAQTTLRVCGDASERALHLRRYVISFLTTAIVVGTLAAIGAGAVILGGWFLWQIYHVLRQHYGIVAMQARAAGFRGSLKLTGFVLASGCTAPVLARLSLGFSGGAAFGHTLDFNFKHFNVPFISLIPLFAYSFAAIVLYGFALQWLRGRRHHEVFLPPESLATLGVALVTYNACYLAIDNLITCALITTIVHAFQYHAITFRHAKGRFLYSTDEPQWWQSGAGSLFVALLVLIFSVALLASSLVLAGAIPFIVFFQHYYMDAFLWRRDKNPNLARDLGLEVSGH